MNQTIQSLKLGWLLLSIIICAPVHSFQLETLDGERDNLMRYIGDDHWTLVFLWATDCVPCEAEKPMIESFHNKFKDHGAVVVGLVLDGREKLSDIEALIERHKPSYPNLVVYTDVFPKQYKELTGSNVRVTPTYLLFKPDSTLAGVHIGPIDEQALIATITGK